MMTPTKRIAQQNFTSVLDYPVDGRGEHLFYQVGHRCLCIYMDVEAYPHGEGFWRPLVIT